METLISAVAGALGALAWFLCGVIRKWVRASNKRLLLELLGGSITGAVTTHCLSPVLTHPTSQFFLAFAVGTNWSGLIQWIHGFTSVRRQGKSLTYALHVFSPASLSFLIAVTIILALILARLSGLPGPRTTLATLYITFAKGLPYTAIIATLILFFFPRQSGQTEGTTTHRQKNRLFQMAAMFWREALFVLCVAVILRHEYVQASPEGPVAQASHEFGLIRIPGHDPVDPQRRHSVELFSGDEHFVIEIEGKILGSDLQHLFEAFQRELGLKHKPRAIPLYMLVSQLSRDGDQGRWWVQEPSILWEDGTYRTRAYLGGVGHESATDGEVFGLVVFIPDDPLMELAPNYAALEDLRQHRLLTSRFFVITRRHNGANAPLPTANMKGLEREQGN